MELRKLSKLLNIPLPKSIDEDELNRIFAVLERRHPTGEDPWGLNLRKSRESAKLGYSLYKHYFKSDWGP